MRGNMIRSLQLSILALICVAFGTLDLYACTASLPKQLHCSSSLLIKDSKTKVLRDYNVDEYLDITAGRSSLSVQDVKRAETKIFYNQLSQDGYGERKFLVYDPTNSECKALAIIDWPLSQLRQAAINLCDLDTLKRDHVDVPIGPSALLFGVMENARNFKYIATIFSKARLINVDVYGRQVRYVSMDGWRKVDYIVHVPSRLNRDNKLKVGDLLSKYLERTTSTNAKLVMVGACLMGDAKPSSLGPQSIPDSLLRRDPDQLDEHTFCDRDHLLFLIRYNFVTERRPGTLVGKSLVQLGQEYVFEREPFLQPVGVGCWGSTSDEQLAPRWQRSLGKSVSMAQLSAEYVTTRGPRGVSFVAYDKARHLLRLDREGRKSIYDLLQRRSYHVSEFSSSSGAQPSEPNIDKCVVLDMDLQVGGSSGAPDTPGMPVVSPLLAKQTVDSVSGGGGGVCGSSLSLIEKLIGLSQDDMREHHLGTRTIDHVAYEVFEREWAQGVGAAPLLLQAGKFKPRDADRKIYLTYYVRLDQEAAQATGASEDDSQAMIVKFVEMWEFDVKLRRKSIVNRLKFTEFSWSLDVSPTNDFEAQTSLSPTLRLFNLEQCYQTRAQQLELVVFYKSQGATEKTKLEESQVDAMRDHELEIGQHLVGMIAGAVEVSRLNIVDLKLSVLPSGDMISSNRIVELRAGLSELSELGRLSESGWRAVWQRAGGSRTFVARGWVNRHSLEECLLDSTAWPEKHWLAFCPQTAYCLLLRRDDESELKKLFLDDSAARVDTEQPVCSVYSFKYSSTSESGWRAATAAAEVNSWLLNRKTLEMSFDTRDGAGFTLKSTPQVRHVKPLDTIGARLANERASLSGLRHTTYEEDPAAINANQRVVLAGDLRGDDGAVFRHCQLGCQMDDLCASFSVCKRANGERRVSDCVLSSLRLTDERTAKLTELGAVNKMGAQFEVQISSECESQVFVMQRDDACTLHTRDFLADYKVTKIIVDKGPDRQQQSEAGGDESGGAQEDEKEEVRRASLDDCAGLSYELNMFSEPQQVNFTYCPLDSECFVKGDEGAQATSTKLRRRGECHVYAKRVSRAYEVKRMHHMSVVKKTDHTESADTTADVAPAAQSPTSKPGAQTGPKKPGELADELEAMGVARRMWGLGEESCARECNLHKSSCLAFDSCRQAGRVLCLLYSIRSPLAKESAYLPPLRFEQQVRARAEVSLVSTLICDHYHLKLGYFEVRLAQLLERESSGGSVAPTTDGGSGTGDGNRKLSEIENLISSSDRERSKQEFESLGREYESLTSEYKRKLQTLLASTKSSWLHVVFLLAGLALGCLGALYKDLLLAQSGAQMRKLPWFRRQTAGHDDLNELVRNDHL